MALFRTAGSVLPRLTRYRLAATRARRIVLGQAGSAVRSAPPLIVWASAAVFLGILVGLSAVILPPAGAFTIPSMIFVIVLWAMPDLYSVPRGVVRKLFFVVLVVDLCVPTYYAIAGTGLPWISIRRLVTFPLILAFAIVIAGSSADRARIGERFGAAKAISICAFGFLAMIWLSVVTADAAFASISPAVDAFLTWYVPFFALVFLVRDEGDIDGTIRVVCWCAILITVAGVVEFFFKHNIFIYILPTPILQALLEHDPTFQNLLVPAMRNGVYRSSSVYATALSFGEFAAMITPMSYYFLFHPRRSYDRIFGWTILITSVAALFAANARGGYLSALAAAPVFAALWVVRKNRSSKASLAAATVAVAGTIGFITLVTSIFTVQRLYNTLIGSSYEAQASAQARIDQWRMALPHIIKNPLTGHGFGNGANVVGYVTGGGLPTLDSSIVSVLVETGVPGLVFFFGLPVLGILFGAREYMSDASPRGAIAGPLACSLVAFLVNRSVLSQRENQMLLYFLVGSVIILMYLRKTAASAPSRRTKETLRPKPALKPRLQQSAST
jgi:O-antigen ligase